MLKFFVEPGYDVKPPQREWGNAGVDFFIPNMSPAFSTAFAEKNSSGGARLAQKIDTDEWVIIVKPHCAVNIPSGLRSRISANVALEAQNKSGVAAKHQLVYGAATVDSNYQGIIHCHLISTSDNEIILPLGTKIVQFIPRFIDVSPIEVVTDGDFNKFYENFEFNNRGDGAFGSTGTK